LSVTITSKRAGSVVRKMVAREGVADDPLDAVSGVEADLGGHLGRCVRT
jgi:hypothetical protein